MIEPEGEARLILEQAGFGLDDVPGASQLARAKRIRVERVPAYKLHGAQAEACRIPDGHRVYVSAVLDDKGAAFAILHELAHVHLGVLRHGGAELETACDAIAGALTCPRTAFRSAVAEYGEDWKAIAADFGTDAACAVLRYGEVFAHPLALVSPATVRVRGDGTWPEEGEIRRLAKAKLPRGLRRTKLPDDPRRTALFVDAA